VNEVRFALRRIGIHRAGSWKPVRRKQVPKSWAPLTSIFALGIAFLGPAGSRPASAEPAAPSTRALSQTSGIAAEVLQPLSQRFADAAAAEAPDFQRHVMPLLGRLGCNGRACHGSFQGRGGFQLSLFGYDFRADHKALLDPATGRIDVDDVEESLVLAKPIDADMHEGGKRMDQDSWQYHVLRNWIRSGARFDADRVQPIKRLEVIPEEIQFFDDQDQVKLTAVAHWADGTREDVTALCRFSTNDDSVAEIDEEGRVGAGYFGDTHVVVSYDRAVVPVPVLRRVDVNETVPTPPKSAHPVDRWVGQKLDKLGIVPSQLCDDAEFIRRVSFDMTGTLPSASDVRRFLEDRSPDKRDRLIDDLLDSPGYAAWWATRFSDWTGNSEAQLNNIIPVRNLAGKLWYEWLRVRLDDNVSYDKIVEGIVVAESRNEGESYLEYCRAMSEVCEKEGEAKFAAREGMPFYWGRRNFVQPEERAIGFAYAFLGVRIECAQCHKHPFDQWSKDDFDSFAKLFANVSMRQNSVQPDSVAERNKLVKQLTGGKKLRGGELRKVFREAAEEGKVIPFNELTYDTRRADAAKRRAMQAARKAGKPFVPSPPTGNLLGVAEPIALDEDPRRQIMSWLRDPENPYFARAIVNRVWANYFGIGIVDPTDDLNLANPPSNRPLLDGLAEQFVQHQYDLKWLHRTIASSHAYQRSTATNPTNASDRVNFSRHVPRRLPAEVIHDAVLLATQSSQKATEIRQELDNMAIANVSPTARNNRNFALQVFGQSARETNCDCDRSDSPSLLQALFLRNDREIYQKLSDRKGWVAEVCRELDVAGPTATGGGNRASALAQAKRIQRQWVSRIKRLNALPESRQKQLRQQLTKQYSSIKQRLTKSGFHIPPLKQLFADPEAWDLEKSEADSVATKSSSLAEVIDQAYLRTLSRFPEAEEREVAVAFIQDSERPSDGLESLMWALVNTKEFILTH